MGASSARLPAKALVRVAGTNLWTLDTIQCPSDAQHMNFDLSPLGARELTALITAAEKRKSALARRRPINIVRAELIAFAANAGYEVSELLGTRAEAPTEKRKKAAHNTGKVAVKYRDPENRRNTWTGRGSLPRWLREKVRRGQSAADFLVQGLAKPTANTNSIGKRTVFKQA